MRWNSIPVLSFLKKSEKNGHQTPQSIKSGTVPHAGDLTLLDQARTANWFFHKITDGHSDSSEWFGRAPLAHAYTLLLTSRKRDFFVKQLETTGKEDLHKTEPLAGVSDDEDAQATSDNEDYKGIDAEEALLWGKAWDFQCQSACMPAAIDVDVECLSVLEEKLFERSLRAGPAGNQQWGLDVGRHQDGWSPYLGLPLYWIHGDRDEHDSELEVCEGLS